MSSAITAYGLSLVILLAGAAPAFAGDFEDGCKSYGAKDYRNAKVSFERVLAVYPKFALGHYYLANVLLSGGQVAQAKIEYQNCLNATPDATTAKYSQDALAKLTKSSAAAPAAAVARPTGTGTSAGTGGTGSATGPSMVAALSGSPIQDAAESAAEARKKVVMDKANAEIRALRADYQNRLDRGDVNVSTNSKYHIGPDGMLVHHYSPETRAIVEGECEEHCDRIRYMAEQQCKFIK
ncbi:hypothetical protein BH11CYA1_BH11CYA1_28190 [soil metagenome]